MMAKKKMRRAMAIGGLILLVVAALLLSRSNLIRGVTPEGFTSYFLENSKAAKGDNKMGPFDGVALTCPDGVSKWKCNTPNEPLNGPEFKPDENELFMFKNNQCKPECCPSSYTCNGGCVCSSPDQRQLIASRGGNRTAPEDSL